MFNSTVFDEELPIKKQGGKLISKNPIQRFKNI